MINSPTRLFFYSVLVFQQILGGLAFPIARMGLSEIPPFVYAFYRFVIAAVLLLILTRFQKNSVPIAKKDWIKILGLGLLIVLLNQVIYLCGQAYTSAAHGAMLFAFTPVFIYAFSIMLNKERMLARRAIGTALAVVGALIIVSQRGLDFSEDMLFGDFLILIAVAVWGLYTVLGKPLAERYGALRVTAYAISLGSLAYAPYGLYRSSSFDIMSVSPTAWFSVFYMAVGVSVVVYSLWYWALRHAEASRIGVFHNIQPLVAAVAGYFMLGEVITTGFVIGGAIVVCGALVVEWK